MIQRKKRNLIPVDTYFIDGYPLEEIPPGPNKKYPGVVLFSQGWDDWYFLRKRDNWTDDDYFRFAEMKMKELGILKEWDS